jgi:cell fate regulator YaaT (PSP1 superfamily)
MCCLGYEYKTYRELAKGMPKMGEFIHSDQGKAKVIDINYLKRSVTAELEDGRKIEVNYPEPKKSK